MQYHSFCGTIKNKCNRKSLGEQSFFDDSKNVTEKCEENNTCWQQCGAR